MLTFKCFQILCVVLTVVSFTSGNQAQDDGVQSNGDASYEFGYDIHNPVSNDIKSHHEVRDGKNVIGFYTFKEADGSIRIVKYKVGPETGFEAVVEKLQPDGPLNGNSIDGQEASPSTHGAPEAFTEPQGGSRSQYVAGLARSIHGLRGIRNPRGDVTEEQHAPAQNHANRNTESQEQKPAQQPQHPPRHRNPYIIRNRYRNDYQQPQLPAVYDRPQGNHYHSQVHNQRLAEDVPRGRQRNQYNQYIQPNQRQLPAQEPVQPYVRGGGRRNRFRDPQVQQYANEQTQQIPYTNAKIVYIDGVAYLDEEGTYVDPQAQTIDPNQVYQGQEQVQEPQYEVRENEEEANDEAGGNVENNDEEREPDKEDYEEEEDEDEEENAEYEEEDDNEDDDADASEFYEKNQELINEQQKEYDKLKKAYENDGQEAEQKEQVDEEKQPVPVQGQ